MAKRKTGKKKSSKKEDENSKVEVVDYRKTVPDEPLEKIIESYERLIYVQASKHLRDRVELEDLMSEGRQGIIEAYRLFTEPDLADKVPNYTFHQAVMYRLTKIFYYCLNNASPLKTPIYIQRGCMHIGQIFKILSNQNAAEEVLGVTEQPTDTDITEFIYDEEDRFPTKDELVAGESRYTLKQIKNMIVRDESDPYFEQILDGILHHRNGNRHTFVKNNLSDKGKVLHIKNKLYFCAKQNKMKYGRLIDLILSARVLIHDLDSGLQKPSTFNLDTEVSRRRVIERGKELVGEHNFNIVLDATLNDLTYGKISEKYGIKKSKVSDIINQCVAVLRNDPIYQQLYEELLI